jgi:hypothetical protein
LPERIRLRRISGWRLPKGARKVDRAFGNPFTDQGTIHRKSLACWGWTLEPSPLAHTPAEAIALVEGHPIADAASLTRVRWLRGQHLACWCPLATLA